MCAILVLAGCGEPDGEVAYDLAALVAEARVISELERLDFGTADTRSYLDEGWSRDESAADGTSFVWSTGESSSLRLFFSEQRDVQLNFRCWRFQYPEAPPQQVTVEVNGATIATVALAGGPAEYRVHVPASVVESGNNRVSFRYRWHRAPRDVIPGATDGRGLAVAWDWLSIDNAFLAQTPSVEDDTLTVPFHTRVEYLLMLPAESVLLIDHIALVPARDEVAGMGLAVTLDTLKGRREDFVAIEGDGPFEIALIDAREPQLALVSLQARARAPTSSGGLRLTKPRVRREGPSGIVAAARERTTKRPHILLYVADTLRADHLGTYGYGGGYGGHGESPSPSLDDFAEDATVFTRAFAQSSWTKSSMASIFSGLTPERHGTNGRDSALPSALVTLSEQLKDLGYDTAGLVTNPNLTDAFGFAQGFTTYEFLGEEDRERGYVRADLLTSRAIEWLSGRESDEPFFLYLHAMDPHDPYLANGERDRERVNGFEVGSMEFMKALEESRLSPPDDIHAQLTELYDAEIRFNDEQFGRLMDSLRELGWYEDLLIVFLSDHGEEFAEHGWWRHGKTLYQEQLHIPLIVKWPKREASGRRVDAVAQHVDLIPTLLDYLGESPRSGLSGRSLLPLVEGSEEKTSRPVTSYLDLDGREVESIVLEDVKLIRYLAHDRATTPAQVFRLDDDPGETHDLRQEETASRDFLAGVLEHRRATASAPVSEAVDIDPDLLEKLRALGYVK